MNDNSPRYLHEHSWPVHELQLALSFVNEALGEIERLQATRSAADRDSWLAAYRDAWIYFAKSHEGYVSRAAALLATNPAAMTLARQWIAEREQPRSVDQGHG